MLTPLEIAPREVKDLIDRNQPLRLLDVREVFEFEQARIEGADLIPMSMVPDHLDELKAETRPIVVLCHHGMRSLQVVEWLRRQGISDCRSMSGGIDQWSCEIDPAVGRYF
jgi:rhodanese-related sulfurtransferase